MGGLYGRSGPEIREGSTGCRLIRRCQAIIICQNEQPGRAVAADNPWNPLNWSTVPHAGGVAASGHSGAGGADPRRDLLRARHRAATAGAAARHPGGAARPVWHLRQSARVAGGSYCRFAAATGRARAPAGLAGEPELALLASGGGVT